MTLLEEHEFAHSSGRQTFYLAAGPADGPLIIFCHGWPAIGATWKHQIEGFSALGFRAVAPDMPGESVRQRFERAAANFRAGYGRSSTTKNIEDYSLENINKIMADLLSHLGRDAAIWIGHDWGAVAVWAFAAHYPEKTTAAACLVRPCHTVEYGVKECISTVNRDIYPEDVYPYGQYDYQIYFEQSFEKAVTFLNADVKAVMRGLYANPNPAEVGKPSITSTVTRDGGWFGGASVPPEALHNIPSTAICLGEDMYEEVCNAFERTGFWSATAWYCNHERNRTYSMEKSANDGYLHMPTLFIGGLFDPINDITVSNITAAQRRYCKDLKEVNLEGGHWVGLEKGHEINAVISRWIIERVPSYWPSK